MPRNFLLLTFTFFFFFLSPVFFAGSEASYSCETKTDIYGQHLSKLQQAYSELSSITFSFSQVTRSGSRSRSGHGDALFVRSLDPERAGIMRWNYTYPDLQIILNDGDELFIYTQRDKQLIIMPAELLNNDITLGLFAGDKRLNDDFLAGPPEERYMFSLPGVELTAFRLLPLEPHPQIKSIQVWFDKNYLIRFLVLVDHFESITELAFSKNVINTIDVNDRQKMEKILFLDISEGTEIIRQ